jgi:hypothetical protein
VSVDAIGFIVVGALGLAAVVFFAWVVRHQHEWSEPVKIAETHAYNGPVKSGNRRLLERSMHGSVTYEQRCADCGKART